MKTSEKTEEIYKSLIEAIPEIQNLYPAAKGFNYDYIPLEQIIDEIKPKLKVYGLAIIQMPISSDQSENEDKVGVITRIIHISGQFIECAVYAKLTNLSKASNTQCLGATITYLRRYGLASVFGIAADVNIDNKLDGSKNNTKDDYEKKVKEFHNLIAKLSDEITDKLDQNNCQNLIKSINSGQATLKTINEMILILKKKYLK